MDDRDKIPVFECGAGAKAGVNRLAVRHIVIEMRMQHMKRDIRSRFAVVGAVCFCVLIGRDHLSNQVAICVPVKLSGWL